MAVGGGDDEAGVKRTGSGSKKALTSYLAHLSNIAQRGVDDPPLEAAASGAKSGDTPHDISPATFRKMSARLRTKLQSQVPVNEDARKQLELLSALDSQSDDSEEWESMRAWMVDVMHVNLDEEEDDEVFKPLCAASSAMSSRRGCVSKQNSMDLPHGRKLSVQDAFDVKPGNVSNQSSLESNHAADT